MSKKTGYILIISISILTLILALLSLSPRRSTQEYKRLYDIRGSKIPFSITWDEVKGIVISGVLSSSSIQHDANGNYINLFLPKGDHVESESNIQAYFRDSGVINLLTLPDGHLDSVQDWSGVFVEELPSVEESTQIVVYAKNSAEEFNRIQKELQSQNSVQMFGVSHITILK